MIKLILHILNLKTWMKWTNCWKTKLLKLTQEEIVNLTTSMSNKKIIVNEKPSQKENSRPR